MRYPLIISGIAACTLSMTAVADTLGFEVGAYGWQQKFSGTVSSGSASLVDVEDNLGYDDETNNVFYAVFEHPVPVLPNIRVQQTDLDLSANGNGPFLFSGTPYVGSVNSSINLSHTDFTLYYEILDNWVSLDVGLTARYISDGEVQITSTQVGPTFGQTESFDADGVLPLLYLSARIDLPLTGLYVGADINGLGVNDDSIIDYRVNLGYESTIGLGVEAGFRSFELDYDDSDDKVDLTIDGAYAGIFYHF